MGVRGLRDHFRSGNERPGDGSEGFGGYDDLEGLGDEVVEESGPAIKIVDPMGRADHITISEAISQADSEDHILVRPGLYQEALVIDKPLEIIGDGNPEEIVVQTMGANAILFNTTMGRIPS